MQEPAAKKMTTCGGFTAAADSPASPTQEARAGDGFKGTAVPPVAVNASAAQQLLESAQQTLSGPPQQQDHVGEVHRPAACVDPGVAAQVTTAELQELQELRAERNSFHMVHAQLQQAQETHAAKLKDIQVVHDMELGRLKRQRQAFLEQLDALGHDCSMLRAAQELQQ